MLANIQCLEHTVHTDGRRIGFCSRNGLRSFYGALFCENVSWLQSLLTAVNQDWLQPVFSVMQQPFNELFFTHNGDIFPIKTCSSKIKQGLSGKKKNLRKSFVYIDLNLHYTSFRLVAAVNLSVVLLFSPSVGQVHAQKAQWAAYLQTACILRRREPASIKLPQALRQETDPAFVSAFLLCPLCAPRCCLVDFFGRYRQPGQSVTMPKTSATRLKTSLMSLKIDG